jgi:hypothetical protein
MKQHASKKSVPPSVGADVAGIESCSTALSNLIGTCRKQLHFANCAYLKLA